MNDFDDILGGETSPPRPRRGRPTNEERAARAQSVIESAQHRAELKAAIAGHTKIRTEEFLFPVTRHFLAQVLNMDPMTVKRRLQGVKPAASFGGSGGREAYYFHEVLPYLVKPKMDLAAYLRTLNPTDMPLSVNKTFWEAERIKNKVLLETGEAWPTERVLGVFGDVFMLIKDRIPLITDALQDMGCNDAQMRKLREMCEQFQADLHEALVEMPKRGQSHSRRADIDMGIEQQIPEFDEDDA